MSEMTPKGVEEKAKRRVLFVDDELPVLRSLRRLLRSKRFEWEMIFVSSVDEALEVLSQSEFDAIISDIQMPIRDGFDLIQSVKGDPALTEIPIVILTGNNERGLKSRALDLGATDLLNKPVEPADLLARITSVLKLKAYQDQMRKHTAQLEEMVRERTAALERSRIDLIWRLSKVGEYRDNETGLHVMRVGPYCHALAKTLGQDDDYATTIFLTSPLHDVGKIGIPDAVLLKPGKLDAEEWKIMQGHTTIGAEILHMTSPTQLPEMLRHWVPDAPSNILDNPFIDFAASIARGHHERWDGRGYPNGLGGEDIPLAARITMVADVYDALGSKRPYKPAFPEEKVLSIMKEGAGTQFDPQVFEAFLDSLDTFRSIRTEFSEE